MMDMYEGFSFCCGFFCYFYLMAKEKAGLDLKPHFSVSSQVGITQKPFSWSFNHFKCLMSPTRSDKNGIDNNFLNKTRTYCYSPTRCNNSPEHKYVDPSYVITLLCQTQSPVRDCVWWAGNCERNTVLRTYTEVTQASAFFSQESGSSSLQPDSLVPDPAFSSASCSGYYHK